MSNSTLPRYPLWTDQMTTTDDPVRSGQWVNYYFVDQPDHCIIHNKILNKSESVIPLMNNKPFRLVRFYVLDLDHRIPATNRVLFSTPETWTEDTDADLAFQYQNEISAMLNKHNDFRKSIAWEQDVNGTPTPRLGLKPIKYSDLKIVVRVIQRETLV